jgi:hypothetical protein
MSPQDLLDRVNTLFPHFAKYWQDGENCFLNDDGSFSPAGVFAALSHFFRDRYEEFSPTQIGALAELLSECTAAADSDLDIAAATCFLENVTGERFSADLKRYLKGAPLSFFPSLNHRRTTRDPAEPDEESGAV